MDAPEKRGPEFYPPEEDDRPLDSLTQTDESHSAQDPPSEQGEQLTGPLPAEPANAPRSVPLLAYLTVLLAVGFLVMSAVCVLQFRAGQRALDEAREAVEGIQSLDQLLEENDLLREQTAALETAAEENEWTINSLQQQLSMAEFAYDKVAKNVMELRFLCFLQNFMDEGNYALASNAIWLNGQTYFKDFSSTHQTPYWNDGAGYQYMYICQELLQLGYLSTPDDPDGGLQLNEEKPENLQWTDFWTALYQYYFILDKNDTHNFQIAIDLTRWTNQYQQLLDGEKFFFTATQYWIMRDNFLEFHYIRETEDGGLELILDETKITD